MTWAVLGAGENPARGGFGHCRARGSLATGLLNYYARTKRVINRWYDGSEPFDLSLIEAVPVDPDLPQIGGRIEEAYLDHTNISASQDIDWLLFTVKFSHTASGAFNLPLQIVEAYEDGFVYRRQRKTLTLGDAGTETAWVSSSWPARAVGKHWVIVYAGNQKVAQVEYQVGP